MIWRHYAGDAECRKRREWMGEIAEGGMVVAKALLLLIVHRQPHDTAIEHCKASVGHGPVLLAA